MYVIFIYRAKRVVYICFILFIKAAAEIHNTPESGTQLLSTGEAAAADPFFYPAWHKARSLDKNSPNLNPVSKSSEDLEVDKNEASSVATPSQVSETFAQ